MRTVQIAASILSADVGRLAEEARAMMQAGVDRFHVDVMDGHFVPNLTFGPAVVQALRRSVSLPLDVHLMIEQPERWIDVYVRAGAHTVYVHAEACVHLHRVLQQIRQAGARAGVVLNPATPLSALEYVLDEVACVLVMTVNPGFGGQSFLPLVVPKIRALSQLIQSRHLPVDIEVDGGIDAHTASHVVAAGASVLVSGSFLFASTPYDTQVDALRRAIVQVIS